jgi:hypothetical protein
MRWITRGRKAPAGVRFCDGCTRVSTAEQRARQRYEDVRARAFWIQPR